jgi:pyrroline-5-carboxylate reductase
MNQKIAIIGGGNLGTAIAEGLIESGFSKPSHIMVTKRNTTTLKHIENMGALVSNNNLEALGFAEIIILAVKPFQVEAVLQPLVAAINADKHILVSVATGVATTDIQKIVGKKIGVIRAMPNTAIAIRQSMTCISAADVAPAALNEVQGLFEQLGKVAMIDEPLMDAATVLGACGTAYAMRYMRANIQGGIEIGFNATTATLIAAQTVKGAAALLLERGTHPEHEIDKVTTPKGCTIAGLNEMEHRGFSSSLIKGIVASFDKIRKG